MQIIAKRTLRAFCDRHRQAETPLRAWHAMVNGAEWGGPADVKPQFGVPVNFVGDNRVVFDIAGNKYWLVAHIAYPFRRVLIEFAGTHADYDRINAETV